MAHLGGGLHKNGKTGYSVDFTTLCRRMREGHPCVYCYVVQGRKNGYNSKEAIDYVPYDGFARTLTPETKAKLNATGGLRLFSYADYLPDHDEDLRQFLNDCTDENLRVKVITKEIPFLEKFAGHSAISVIQLSIDSLKGPPEGRSSIDWDIAREWKDKEDRVVIRSVVIDHDDVELFGAADWCDIMTLNHAVWPKSHGRTFHLFTKKEKKAIAKRFPGKVCAAGPSGKCKDCPIKCCVPRLDRELKKLDDHKLVTV